MPSTPSRAAIARLGLTGMAGRASGQAFDCLSPIDGRVLAKVAQCGAQDIDRAVAAGAAGVITEQPIDHPHVLVADSAAGAEWAECLAKGEFARVQRAGFDLIETMRFDPASGIARLELHLDRMKASALDQPGFGVRLNPDRRTTNHQKTKQSIV